MRQAANPVALSGDRHEKKHLHREPDGHVHFLLADETTNFVGRILQPMPTYFGAATRREEILLNAKRRPRADISSTRDP
jgi:hypothetical protein